MKFCKSGVLGTSLVVSALFAGFTQLSAATIPYPNAGTTATGLPIIATGSSTIFYYGFNAADMDTINILDITKGIQSGAIFANQTTGLGSAFSMATTPGDFLVIEILHASTGSVFYSGLGLTSSTPTTTANGGSFYCAGTTTISAACQPAAAGDAVNHAYETPYSGGSIPGTTVNPGAGLFIGLEDLDVAQGSDFDYNDDQFVLTGVTTAVTPEPGSFALIGTGILSAAGLIRRRLIA